jgi:predicted phosphodiesterase
MAHRRAERVAVLADIHGNLPALGAVLAEPDVAAADAVVLLGDIALGPMPAQTLEVLAGLGERAVWVHGNCEREMVAAFAGTTVPGPNGPQAATSAALISRRHRDMLDHLPLSVTLEIDGLGVCGFCHASPRCDDEMLLVDSAVAVMPDAKGLFPEDHPQYIGIYWGPVRGGRRDSRHGPAGGGRTVV